MDVGRNDEHDNSMSGGVPLDELDLISEGKMCVTGNMILDPGPPAPTSVLAVPLASTVAHENHSNTLISSMEMQVLTPNHSQLGGINNNSSSNSNSNSSPCSVSKSPINHIMPNSDTV